MNNNCSKGAMHDASTAIVKNTEQHQWKNRLPNISEIMVRAPLI